MDLAQKRETKRDFAPIILLSLTLFLSASLMFTLQPMFGKALLPLLGGAASVWNTCMVFYQSLLFLGYLYAHLLCNRFCNQRQILIHGILLLFSLCFLPVTIAETGSPPTQGNPTLWLLVVLTISIGLPFFILSATSPLLQKWFSKLGHRTSNDPYFLSIASNTGSLMALLSYPFAFEPEFGLSNQQQFWSIGFLLLCSLIIMCMLFFKPQNNDVIQSDCPELNSNPEFMLKLKWLILSFVPSSLLLGVTNYISIDIASVPLLWVIPLALYLLSFIIVFSRFSGKIHKGMLIAQPWLITPFLIYFFSHQKLAFFSLELSLHLMVFFISIMLCHGELAKNRPQAKYLTNYYLIMSFGGMLGGIFNNFITPFIFDSFYEYPLMIIIALLLNPTNRSQRFYLHKNWFKAVATIYILLFLTIFYFNYQQFSNALVLGLIIVAVVANFFVFHKNLVYLALYSSVIVACAIPSSQKNSETLHQSRNFYGVLTIKQNTHSDIGTLHELYSGSTDHGAQIINDQSQCTPIGYYSPIGPLGQLFNQYDPINQNWQVGIIGLGTGELAAYAKDSQFWRFFELNPAVVDIAKNPNYFTYLSNCIKNYDIEIGDARLALKHQPQQSFDLLVVDAFTSDSIPTHLLTREALELYFSKLTDNGLLAMHISNRHLELKRVLADHANKLGLTLVIQEFSPRQKSPLAHKSDWAVFARDSKNLKLLLADQSTNWQTLSHYAEAQSWTDDFTSIIKIWK